MDVKDQGQVTPEQGETKGEEEAAKEQVTQEPEKTTPEPKYTDADLDKLKGNARTEARERRDREILEQTGAESLEQLGEWAKARQEQEEAAKTEIDKANERVTSLETERDTAVAEREEAEEAAFRAVAEAKMELKLNRKGAREDKMGKLFREINYDALDVDDEGNLTGLDEEVERLATEEADWFGTTKPTGVPLSPSGSNGGSSRMSEESRAGIREKTFSNF